MTMNDEQLDSLLRQADPSPGMTASSPNGLADRVRTQHAAIRRRRTRTARIVTATTCYVAGVLSMWLWMQPVTLPEAQEAISQDAAAPSTPSRAISDRDRQETGPAPHEAETPPVAQVTPAATPYEALRTLGDRYLLQQGKVEQAVAAYGRALDQAYEEESVISYEHDSWLLISLKRGRLNASL